MRILFLTHYFKPEGNAPANRVYESCRRWVEDGHEVTVVTCAPNVPDGVVYEGYRNKLFQEETIDGIRVIRLWTYIAANKGTAKRILNYMSFAASVAMAAPRIPKHDCIVATSPQFFAGWAGVILSKLHRSPFILEIRDLWPESIVAVGALKSPTLIRFLEKLERRMYAAADHIVTVGDGYRRQLLERNVPDYKISVIPNGADMEDYQARPKDPELVEKYGLEGHYTVAYGGTIGMACALDVVLDAASLAKKKGKDHLRFLLIGDGAERERLQRTATERGLDNVIFTGRVPKEEMPRYLSVADAALVHLRNTPLFRTVLPSKIFEAAAMEKPIICGVEGEACDIVRRSRAGLTMAPESATDLLQASLHLQNDKAEAAAMGRRGRAYVEEHFNRDGLASSYLKLIRRVSGQHEPPQETPVAERRSA